MSGGSYDYFYHKLEEFESNVRAQAGNDMIRIAFADHLKKVVNAAHAIEWVDSCDWSPGAEHDAIMLVIKPDDVINAGIPMAEEVRDMLQTAIEQAKDLSGKDMG